MQASADRQLRRVSALRKNSLGFRTRTRQLVAARQQMIVVAYEQALGSGGERRKLRSSGSSTALNGARSSSPGCSHSGRNSGAKRCQSSGGTRRSTRSVSRRVVGARSSDSVPAEAPRAGAPRRSSARSPQRRRCWCPGPVYTRSSDLRPGGEHHDIAEHHSRIPPQQSARWIASRPYSRRRSSPPDAALPPAVPFRHLKSQTLRSSPARACQRVDTPPCDR